MADGGDITPEVCSKGRWCMVLSTQHLAPYYKARFYLTSAW